MDPNGPKWTLFQNVEGGFFLRDHAKLTLRKMKQHLERKEREKQPQALLEQN